MRPLFVLTVFALAALGACQSGGQRQFAKESAVNAPVEAVVQSESGRQAAAEAAQSGETATEAVEEAPAAAAATGAR